MCQKIKKKYKGNGGFKKAVTDIKNRLGINAQSFKNWNGVCELFKKYDESNFFKSKQAEYLFYLTKLEGKQRNNLLGLTDEHYENKQLANQWYREIAKYIHPDKNGDTQAFLELKKIYDVLIEDE